MPASTQFIIGTANINFMLSAIFFQFFIMPWDRLGAFADMAADDSRPT